MPRTIFDDSGANHFSDQLAWFSEPDGTPLLDGIAYIQQAGSFDFIPHVLTALTKNEFCRRISGHYRLWAEFRLDGT